MNTSHVRVKLIGFIILFAISCCSGQDAPDLSHTFIPNITYTGGDTLKADFYLPPDYKQQKNPVLIFFAQGDFRNWQHYKDWAKLSASEGFVAINYASRASTLTENFNSLLSFIRLNSVTYYIDFQRLAIFAGSGNVSSALPIANENKMIKAAIMYYGTAKIKEFRTDLPVLLVRAGLDNIDLNKKLDTLAFRALQGNAPYTVFNFNTGGHPFEDIRDPDKIQVMKESLDFLKTNLSSSRRDRYSKLENEITAVREMYAGNWSVALGDFMNALKNNPGDNEIERKIGNVFVELQKYPEAIKFFDDALAHGNWRRGEIALQKCLAYAALNNIEASVSEMRILRQIGWFDESNYVNKNIFRNVVQSQVYLTFVKEKN